MPSREAKEPLKRNTPNSMGTPNFIPNQEGKRIRSSKKPAIATLKSLLAREAGQLGTWGNPAPLQLPRVEGAAEMCLQPPVPGSPRLAPKHLPPGSGVPKRRTPQFSSFLPPNPSTLRAAAPAPRLARRGSGALGGPKPPPLPGEPPPQLLPRRVIGCSEPGPRL